MCLPDHRGGKKSAVSLNLVNLKNSRFTVNKNKSLQMYGLLTNAEHCKGLFFLSEREMWIIFSVRMLGGMWPVKG